MGKVEKPGEIATRFLRASYVINQYPAAGAFCEFDMQQPVLMNVFS